jgi:predicted porin
MSRLTILWVFALMLICGRQAHGADSPTADRTDLEGWTSVELKYKFNKQWMVSAEEQVRLKDDVSEVDKYFSQFGVRYNAPRGLSLDGGYRWIRANDTQGQVQGYESEHRYHVSTSYGHKLGRFSLGYRMRYQEKSTSSGNADRHLRFRARVRYNLPDWKLDPVFAAELYRPVGDDADSGFDKMRFALGTNWNTWGDGEMGVFYRLEKELDVDLPQTTHIIGLRFTHLLGKN